MKGFLKRFSADILDPEALDGYASLMSAAEEFTAESLRRLAPYALADGRAHVLALLLDREPNHLSHSELAELMGVTKGNITGLVDGLEREGYVKRTDRSEDRRVMPIALTAKGKRQIEEALRHHMMGVAASMSVLEAKEQKQLVNLLTKLRTKLAATRAAS
jgi:DNA-binding MarR family transcriptional regulator